LIPNQKEIDRIMDKAVDLVNDREVNYLMETILYLQGQVKLYKDLYHNVSNEAEKQLNELKLKTIPIEFGTGELLVRITELEEELEEAKEGEIYWKRRFDDLKHEVVRLNDKIDFIEINAKLDQ
jgi:hypothetical protein